MDFGCELGGIWRPEAASRTKLAVIKTTVEEIGGLRIAEVPFWTLFGGQVIPFWVDFGWILGGSWEDFGRLKQGTVAEHARTRTG